MTCAKKRVGIDMLAAVVAIVLCTSAAAADNVAERPEWKVGDKWVFRAVENPGAKQSTWSHEVVAELPDSRVQVMFGNGSRIEFDGEANSIDKQGPEYTWRRFKFPMAIGTSWSHERKLSAGDEKSSWKVVAFEKLTVPAGTFDCFKVEGEAYRNRGDAAAANKQWAKGYTKTTYCYCPAVKWAAKWEIEDTAYVSAPRVVTVSELTAFSEAP